MIRAIIKNGTLQPLDPLPADWVEGQTLEIEAYPEPAEDARSLEQWYRELETLVAENPMSPEDMKQLEESLAEEDRLAKEQVRREIKS